MGAGWELPDHSFGQGPPGSKVALNVRSHFSVTMHYSTGPRTWPGEGTILSLLRNKAKNLKLRRLLPHLGMHRR